MEETAATVAIRCTIDGGQEAIMAILDTTAGRKAKKEIVA
jgi:hypothetical protein